MTPRDSTAEWIAETQRYIRCEEERNALPASVTAGLSGVLGGRATSAERQDVFRRIDAYRGRSRRRIEHWLRALDGQMALDMVSIKRALTTTRAGHYLSLAGFNRFHWILAVAGRGHDRREDSVTQYVKACGEWMAATQLIGVVAEVDPELARGIHVNPWRESNRRTTAILVHFRWASELLCTSFAAEVQSDTAKYNGLEFVTPAVVRELYVWVDGYVRRQERLMGGHQAGAPPLMSPECRSLLEALAVEGETYHAWSFEKLVTTLEIEAYPFIKIGETLAPVAFREATYTVELALFNMARLRLANDKDRSDLFENVVKRCLGRVLPSDIDVPPAGEIFCPVQGTANKGETDFIMRDSSKTTFIGECKSMAAVPLPGTVINAFTNDVGKAVKQVMTRIRAVKDGCVVSVDGRAWHAPRSNVYGIIVPLHAYGGAVWNYDCLPESGAVHQEIAVIPVHQLLLVARAMNSASDLGDYIRFRQSLFDLRFELHDELDILAAFIFLGDLQVKDLIAGAPPHGARILRAYGAELDAMVSDTIPSSAKAWRRRLKTTLT